MADTSKYTATFELIDVDGDGLITAAELKHLIEALGGKVTDEAAIEAVRVLDDNGDGLVSLAELADYLDESTTPTSA